MFLLILPNHFVYEKDKLLPRSNVDNVRRKVLITKYENVF